MEKKKLGRKPKVSIPDEDINNLVEGTVTPKDLAEKHGVTANSMSVLKHKKKLKTSMKLNLADQSISNNQKIVSDQTKPQLDTPPSMQKVYDYDTLVKGLWGGVDSILILIATLSRGQIEYTKLTPEEIESLTNASKNNSFMQRIATIDQIGSLIMVGTIAVIFNGKFKIKHKHKEDDPKCKCDECKLARNEIKEIKSKVDKVIEKEEIKEDKVKSILTNLDENILDQPNANFDLDGNGLKIEKNIPKEIKSEEEVLRQNKKESTGQKQLGASLQW